MTAPGEERIREAIATIYGAQLALSFINLSTVTPPGVRCAMIREAEHMLRAAKDECRAARREINRDATRKLRAVEG